MDKSQWIFLYLFDLESHKKTYSAPRYFNHNEQINRRPVSSVGRALDYRAGGRGLKPWPDHHSGSLNN